MLNPPAQRKYQPFMILKYHSLQLAAFKLPNPSNTQKSIS